MKKKWICMLLLVLWAAVACAEPAQTFTLWFEEGFSLSIPEGWVSYAVSEADADANVRYALGDGDGKYMYILAEQTEIEDFAALREAIDAREDCTKCTELKLNGQPFAAFIVPGLNASGCATLLDGELFIFLFTPQNDSDYMLEIARIMASFEIRRQ